MMTTKRLWKCPLRQSAPSLSPLLVWFLLACAPKDKPGPCPLDMPTPPFRLTVDTTEPGLSADLEIHVVYGGDQTETYRPGTSSTSPDICCATLATSGSIPERVPCSESAADAAVTPVLVVCDLWTGGAAILTIKDSHQVYASQTLQAQPRSDVQEGCGLFETIEAQWTYGLSDAGVAIHE
jgi:hypothetical protein